MNVFGTKELKEIKIVDYPLFWKGFIKTTFKADEVKFRNKKILLINLDALVSKLVLDSTDNELTVITTRKKNYELLKHRYKLNIYYLDDITKLEEFMLIKGIKKNSMDYIFANPPYDKNLYLDISETLLSYINETGSMHILGPLMPITIPFKHKSKTRYAKLWKHLSECTIFDEKYHDAFDSFKGFTILGVMTFKQKENFYNINKLWKQFYSKDEVSLYEKLMSYKGPKIKDKICKNINKGIIVPMAGIGGITKKYAVMDSIMYVNNGECLAKINGEYTKISVEKYNGKGCDDGKVSQGVVVNNVDEAVRFYKKYRHNYILKGIFDMSLGGGQHPHWNIVPFFDCKNDIDDEFIIDELKLNENDLRILRRRSMETSIEDRYSGGIEYGITKRLF